MARTATTAMPIFGDKLYQERARAALPLLVRQAEAATPIHYSALARELEMPNPRNLNYVLGCVGQTMEVLSKRWRVRVPPIQCLVVNKSSGLPGEGIGWFLVKKEVYGELPLKRKREIVQAELEYVFSFPRWHDVLDELSLSPTTTDFTNQVRAASRMDGGGEGPEHRRLKEFVAANPGVIGLSNTFPLGSVEEPLPSGDCLDVSFRSKSLWIAAEVKPVLSGEPDIVRGIFQCVKYRAVLDAVLLSESLPQNSRAILVLGGIMSPRLVSLANLLGVEVIQEVSAG